MIENNDNTTNEILNVEVEILPVLEDNTDLVFCDLEDLIFPVRIMKDPMPSNKEIAFKVITQVTGYAEKCVNQCSDTYNLIPNEEIFPKIEELLDSANIGYLVQYSHINNSMFYAEYTITDKELGYTFPNTNDVIMPKINVTHSYNGRSKYTIIFGYFRLICSNGLVIAVEAMKMFNLKIVGKHTDKMDSNLIKLTDMLVYFSENATTITAGITANYAKLVSSIPLNVTDRITAALEACKITAVENKNLNTVSNILDRIKFEANDLSLGYNGIINDWLIYNGINNYIHDNTLNKKTPEVRAELDSKAFQFLLKK